MVSLKWLGDKIIEQGRQSCAEQNALDEQAVLLGCVRSAQTNPPEYASVNQGTGSPSF